MTEPPERLIRKADFARLVGVSHPAISKAVRDGRLTPALRMHNGREVLALRHARQLWQQCRREPPPLAPEELESLEEHRPTGPLAGAQSLEDLPPLHASRARREHYRAERLRLEVEALKAQLVPAREVEEEAARVAAEVRSGLAALADRLAPQVAAAKDVRSVHLLLSEGIRCELMRLADPPPPWP